MDQTSFPKGSEPVFVEEILMQLKDAVQLEGKSVRITGKLDEHDPNACVAMVTDPQTAKKIHIDTRLIEPFPSRKGSLLQFIGELDCLTDSYDVILKARLVRGMDGVDMVMYRKAVEAQRHYLETRVS